VPETYEPGEKIIRVVQLLNILSSTETGRSTKELAAELEVVPRTVQRYIQTLRDSVGLDVEESNGRWRLGKHSRLPALQLDRYQATLLLIALRLLHRSRPEQDPALLGALAQLSRALQVPLVTRYLQRMLQHAEQKPVNPERRTLERTVVDAFVMSRALEIDYVDGEGRASRRVVHPYFLEPAVEGRHVYVYSHDVQARGMRALRLDRVTSARMLPQTFDVPDDFDIDDALGAAWGVWHSDTPDDVVLRFVPEAARLVPESRWHPSAQLVPLPDGGIELRLRVASETEMRPWVMRWGPLVEVIEPASLRAWVADAHARAAALYAKQVSGRSAGGQ
jgi:predicted DNA-binding transcriptional regulator YafY